MARPKTFHWPLSSTTSICALQSLAGAGTAEINGSLATATGSSGSTYRVVLNEIGRTVSITSANNLSGVNFTINGFMNGSAVTSTIAGPNANTVQTAFGTNFDTITSITTSGAAAAFSVGTGLTGVTHWFNSDIYVPTLGMAIQVDVTGNISYSFQTTLDDVQTVASPLVFTPIAALTTATTDQLGSYLVPARYSRLAVLAATTDATGTLTTTFLQQGMN